MVPLIILLPQLGNLGEGLSEVGVAVLEASLFIAAMAFFGTRIFPWLMARIASFNSRELFLISVVAIGLGIGIRHLPFWAIFRLWRVRGGYGYEPIGLQLSGARGHSAAAGYFRHALLCFGWDAHRAPVSLGERDDGAARRAARVFGQGGAIFGGITRIFGYGNIAPFAVSLGLFQVGEFSFVIARERRLYERDIAGDLLNSLDDGGRYHGFDAFRHPPRPQPGLQ